MSAGNIILSIVIPVYNAEKTLRETLDSVLGQSLKEIEVICVDDGSKDRSVSVVEEYIAKDRRVSMIRQQNLYAGAARNAGIEAARGEYLFFLDADDYVLDYALEAVCHKARKHRLDCLKFLSLTYDEKGNRFIDKKRNSGGFLLPEDFGRLLKAEQGSPLLRISVTPWSGIYRREFVIEKNCRFNRLRCVNDRSFWTKVMTTAERIMLSQDRVTVHRENQDHSLVGNRARNFDCQIDSVGLTEKQLTEDGIDPDTTELIMSQEYQDLEFWYRRFAVTQEQKDLMDREITERLEGKDNFHRMMLEHIMQSTAVTQTAPAPANEVKPYHQAAARPAVTVLMPVLNAEETLNLALDSLTNQTLENMEFLLTDLGSTDGSGTIMKEYAAIDKRFTILEGNEGYGRSMNQALQQARGSYIALMKPEDYAEKDLYEKLYREARKRRLDIVRADYCRFRISEDGVRENRGAVLSSDGADYNKTMNPGRDRKVFFFPLQSRNGLYRRKMLEQNGIRFNEEDGTLTRDNGFWFLAHAYARRMRILRDTALYMERMETPEGLAIPEAEEENIIGEYRFIREKLAGGKGQNGGDGTETPIHGNALAGVMYDRQLKGMLGVWSRLDSGRRLLWLYRIREEMKEPYEKGLTDETWLTKQEQRRLKEIVEDPEAVMKRIDLSVILPAGREWEGIEDALKPLLCKSGAIIEVIREEAGEDPGQARNAGLQKARGTYCFFPESGDRFETGMLDAGWTRAETKNLDVVVFPGDVYHEDTRSFSEGRGAWAVLLPAKRPFAGTDMDVECFNAFTPGTGDKLFRTDFLREKGITFAADAEDGDPAFAFAAIVSAGKIDVLGGAPLMHHAAGGSAMESRSRHHDGGYSALIAFREQLQRLGLFERFEKDFVNYALYYSLRKMTEAPAAEYKEIYRELTTHRLNELGITRSRPKVYFFDPDEYEMMKKMRETDAEDFLLYASRTGLDKAEELGKPLQEEEENPLLHSASYRIGRAVTMIPRKIRTGVWMVREQGAGAAWKYMRRQREE